jgi:hypothetical protein
VSDIIRRGCRVIVGGGDGNGMNDGCKELSVGSFIFLIEESTEA